MMELTTEYQRVAQAKLGNSYGDLYIRIYAKYSEQDIPNNRTYVSYQARAYYSGSTYILDGQSNGNVSGTGATTATFTKKTNYNSGETTLKTISGWVTHEADGTKTITCSAKLNFPLWSWSKTATGTATLPTLHTPPTITNVVIRENNTQLRSLSVPDTTLVNFLSIKQLTITATPYDDATITDYYAYDDYGNELDHKTSNVLSCNFSNNDLTSAGIRVKVRDSLNAEGNQTTTYDFIKYIKPTIELSSTTIKRKTGAGTYLTDNTVALNLIGTYYHNNNIIGNANSFKIRYKIWRRDQTEPNYSDTLVQTLDPEEGTILTRTDEIHTEAEVENNNITIDNYLIVGVDYREVYNYKIIIVDNFTSYSNEKDNGTIPTGRAVWSEYKDRVNFIKATMENKLMLTTDDVYYKSGDIEETTGNLVLGAYITSSTTELNFTIMTPKRLDNITSITADSIYISARGTSGYLNSESGYHEFVGRSGYTITVSKSNENSITISIRKSSAWTNVTNNTPCAVNGNFKFTLN